MKSGEGIQNEGVLGNLAGLRHGGDTQKREEKGGIMFNKQIEEMRMSQILRGENKWGEAHGSRLWRKVREGPGGSISRYVGSVKTQDILPENVRWDIA